MDGLTSKKREEDALGEEDSESAEADHGQLRIAEDAPGAEGADGGGHRAGVRGLSQKGEHPRQHHGGHHSPACGEEWRRVAEG